jgi:pimeloyl-ACP methyl ester carboxylesterase
MPLINRPDGAVIHYEVHGQGFPLLLIAPGGVNSQVEFWAMSPFNPIAEFSGEFQVIAMDQRFAGRSHAPAKPFSYDDTSADQLAVLDAAGVDRALVMGGCIGCAHIFKLLQVAPERFAAAVPQNPVGLDETNTMGTFYAMFDESMRLPRAGGVQAVVDAALKDPMFVRNNGAGPFAQRIHDDAEFRAQVAGMTVEGYVALIVRFRDGIWPPGYPYFTATEEWMRQCPVPLLVLPGSDPFHPTGIGRKICADAPDARCLDTDWKEPGKVKETVETVRAFLREHAQKN